MPLFTLELPPNRNPQNPWVINDHYFSNQTTFDYSTPLASKLRLALNLAAFSVGTVLTSLILYLIKSQTPQHFKPYSKMVLLSACVDLIFLLIDVCNQVRLKVADACAIISLASPVSYFSYEWQCIFVSFNVFTIFVASAILPVQYAFRWHMIKDNKAPNFLRIFTYILISIFPIFPLYICVVQFWTDQAGKNLNFDYAQLWFKEVEIPVLLVGSMTDFIMIFAVIYGFVVISIYYSVSYYFTYLTIKSLNRPGINLSEKTRALQNQFFRVLFVQSTTPILTSFLPLSLIATSLVFKLNTEYVGEYAILSLNWTPVINSLSTLILIQPYRQFCVEKVKSFLRKIRGTSNNVQTINDTTTNITELSTNLT